MPSGPGEQTPPAKPTTTDEKRVRFPRAHAYIQRHEFLASVTKVMSGTGLAQLVAALATLYVTHHIDPSDWGIYGAIMAVSQFVIPAAALRYEMAIVLPRDDSEAKRVLRLATRINAVVSTLAMLAMIPMGGFLSGLLEKPEARWWLLAVGPIVFTYTEVSVVNYWANRRKRFGVIGTNALWCQSTTAVGRITSCAITAGALGQVVATFLGKCLALNNFRRRLGPDLRNIKESDMPMRAVMRKYRQLPLLTAPNAIVDAIRQQGVNMIIMVKFSTAGYGRFSIAWTLMQMPAAVINQALSQVFFQKLSVSDAGKFYQTVKKSVVRSLLVGIVPFGLLYVLIPPVLPWLLGAKFEQSADIAVALVPWLYVNFVTSPISNMFIVTRNNGIALIFAIIYAVVPLTYLNLSDLSIVGTIYQMSFIMAGLLVFYIGLALVVAKRFDKKNAQVGEKAEVSEDSRL
ncbi:lipopolysaccharide biosynthesis protein [Cutibacterium sp.]|uniref:lipopolysaccharide biosynthesis protein n=1 Tax=Cutibacterium sp. TaxID=1912221 RepID=UPI0034C6AE38